MTRRNVWEEFFDGQAPVYMDYCFTKNTLIEVDFLLDELKLPSGSSILDVGCGTGRHAVELARRGYQVTGVDISFGMLAEAEKAARQAGIRIEWIHADATEYTSNRQFDAAICLCEGAFGLLGKDDDPMNHDLSILNNIYSVLKPGAKLILTVINALAVVRKHSQKDVVEGRFDPITMVETSSEEYNTPQGKNKVVLKERGYVPTELELLFRQAGFNVNHIWGGTAGNWGRRPIDLDEIEVMIIAQKSYVSA